MMVRIAELKAKLSAYIARVQAGDEVEITNHGRAVARLVGVEGIGFVPPASKTFPGKVELSRVKHQITNIDELLDERRKQRAK